MSAEPSGFALRKNGTCDDVDCGSSRGTFRACCPPQSSCPQQYNRNCCPTSDNCTMALVEHPRCANESWDLFDNNGYFCCEKGLPGYATTTDSNGCASPGYAFKKGETMLELIAQDRTPTSSDTTTPSPNSPESNSNAPVGAIAGGTVGGVAVLALASVALWFFFLKKRKREPDESPPEHTLPSPSLGAELEHKYVPLPPRELDGAPPTTNQLSAEHGVSELSG